MTKYQIAEQVQRILYPMTTDQAPDIREFMLAVSNARDYLIKKYYFVNKQEESSIGGEFVSTYKDVLVKTDTETNLFYAELPAAIIDLPSDKGVYQVSLMKDQTNVFIPVRNGFMSLYGNLDAGRLQGRQAFWVEGDKIVLPFIKISDNISKLLVKLIQASDTIAEDVEFPCSGDMVAEIIDMVLQKYGVQKNIPQDSVNDGLKN